MNKGSVTVKDITEYFDYEVLSGEGSAFERNIDIADTNRPGLELAGYFHHSQKGRIVILGEKETEYIKTMEVKAKNIAFDFITSSETPAIIISRNLECPSELLEIAKAKNFPLLRSSVATSRLIINLVSYLDERLCDTDAFHGVLMSIFGKGVMIRGESGMGKSEVALDLIRRGHQLVSDDLVECSQVHNTIIGTAPKLLKGMLELRGIGIIDVNKLYGATATLPKAEIELVIELKMWNPDDDYDRVGIEEPQFEELLDVQVPKIVLPLRGGRSMSIIIESAVSNMILKSTGYDSAKEFEHKVLNMIADQKEEGIK